MHPPNSTGHRDTSDPGGRRPPSPMALPAAAPLPVVLPTLELEGFSASVDAYAGEPEPEAGTPRLRLWLVSLLGTQQSVKALWARLVRGEVATMRFDAPGGLGGARFCALAPEGPRRWRFFTAGLPASAGHHGVLVPEAALFGSERLPFVLLPRRDADAAALHYRFLNRRLDLPFHASWADWLWTRALRTGEVVPLEAHGLCAFRCAPDAQRLAGDLSAAVARGELSVSPPGLDTDGLDAVGQVRAA